MSSLLFCWLNLHLLLPAQDFDFKSSTPLIPPWLTLNHENELSLKEPDKRVLLANSVQEYPVTPGDIYQLSYLGTNNLNTFESMVTSDFTLPLNLFGIIRVHHMSYNQLREKVKLLVLQAYPQSKPQFMLRSTGIFQIYLKGEVNAAGFINCWGLTRLSEVIQGRTTAYTSFRRVEVVSTTEVVTTAGTVNVYDLFAALQLGEQDQDPYVKPGDTVVLHPYERQIKVSGEVFKPGIYQLREKEELNELIQLYAKGFTALSDTERLQIQRSNPEDTSSAGTKAGETYYLNALLTELESFTLRDGDEVYIPSQKEKLPIVYFEGAVKEQDPAQAKILTTSEKTGKLTYPFRWGEKLSTALRSLQSRLATDANLGAAYILRQGQAATLPVNLIELIHNYSPEKDIELAPYDRIIIPFKQYWVNVSGAVQKPGPYPFFPERSYLYYLEQAGGAIREKNLANRVKITDSSAKRQPVKRPIEPEDTIYVYYNHPLYHISQWAVLVSATISVTTLVVSLVNLSK
jgi:protein involved in polysaccharide export with SLBB domain